jgi:membrane protein YqaA with SNARE-associated domain
METIGLSAIEKEMANFNFDELSSLTATAKANIAKAANASDIIAEICKIWKIVRKYVILLEKIPIIGKFITTLAGLLDLLCPGS